MKMTGEEFCKLIKKDPSWCKNLKESLEITTYVLLTGSNITHLSPLLTFSGRDEYGVVAHFNRCKKLKIATGTFNGFVSFRNSGLEKIKGLTITETDVTVDSASFIACKNLKVATGNYKGCVSFYGSGVETIKNLIIKNPNTDGEKAHFNQCPIKYVPKEYREKNFTFEKGTIEKSVKKDREDAIKKTVKKIKSETNNIEI